MDDLIGEFITETSESLGVLDQELVKFEQNPNDAATLGNIFRLVHTIKGTCGFLGLPRLEKVAHASENVLGKIRDKQLVVTPPVISLVLESLDAIKIIVEHLTNTGAEPEGGDVDLIARLNKCASNDGGDGAAAPAEEVVFDKPAAEAPPATEEKPVTEQPVSAPPPPSAPPPSVETGEAKEAAAPGGGAAAQTIRVNLDVLENLMQVAGELVLTRNQLLQLARARQDSDFLKPLQLLSHITTELQEGVMKTRMQPIGNAWSKFPRLIRDVSHELNKKIELRMVGAETELDRQLLELIKDPLTHMVRNSCDHGLEKTEERIAAGKPETGTVTLSAYHEGGHIIVEIVDDGRGLNFERIKQKAIANGLTTESAIAEMTNPQIAQFIFMPGFSTAEQVTSLSGRGVGMDVVRTNIEKMGGNVEIASTPGKGSRFMIKIPLTLAIVSVLLVGADGQQFAIPQINVVELVRAAPGSEHVIEEINGARLLRLRERLLPLRTLREILGFPLPPESDDKHTFVVVCRVGGSEFGLIVDRVFDTEEIVVKPVATPLKQLSVYAGNTILGDGSVIMILDANGLNKIICEKEVATRSDEDSHKVKDSGERVVNFLVFAAGKGAPKAVPLELVSRLEELDASTFEYSNEQHVVQYRNDLMRLVTLDDSYALPKEGLCEVIVFTYDGKITGLVVERIQDIMEAPLALKLSSKTPKCLGSQVVAGKTTDILDVGSLLNEGGDSLSIVKNSINPQAAQKTKLLFVEDSMFFRNMTTPFLTAVGFTVTAVENGSEALRVLNKQVFDLIISDIEMPVMDGFELAEMCQASAALRAIPVIAFTSTINQQVLKRGKEAGFREFILKTDRQGLVKAINTHLSQEEAA